MLFYDGRRSSRDHDSPLNCRCYSTNNGAFFAQNKKRWHRSRLEKQLRHTVDAGQAMPICLGAMWFVQTSPGIFSVDVFAWKTGEQHVFVEFFTDQWFVATCNEILGLRSAGVKYEDAQCELHKSQKKLVNEACDNSGWFGELTLAPTRASKRQSRSDARDRSRPLVPRRKGVSRNRNDRSGYACVDTGNRPRTVRDRSRPVRKCVVWTRPKRTLSVTALQWVVIELIPLTHQTSLLELYRLQSVASDKDWQSGRIFHRWHTTLAKH